MKLNARHILDRVGRANAFTLLEILIAVAALGLIAVGVSAIFAATGKTVTAGRRVSAFNSYAALIEQQLRADIAAMTRDGFLVVRNEYASQDGSYPSLPPWPIPLYEGDEHARPRRIDELLFFAKGEFTSARTPLSPSVIAKGDAARIYYGHGARGRPPGVFNSSNEFYTPEIIDDNTQTPNQARYLPGGNPGTSAAPNPNFYASDWTLLRQVTVLCPPRTAEITPPVISGVAANQMVDSPTQIALQPAAASVFRSVTARFPDAGTTTSVPEPTVRDGATLRRCNFASGLVDIAATDLSTIRSIFTTASVFPGPDPLSLKFFDAAGNSNTLETGNFGVDNVLSLSLTGTPDPNTISRMQSWMDDAFPAFSMAQGAQINLRARVRYEPSPPNFVGVLADTTLGTLEKNYRAADQVMLSASNFLPRCTEFIIEWSFGKTYPSDPAQGTVIAGKEGQLIWHGMDRRIAAGTNPLDVVAEYYKSTDLTQRVIIPYALVNGTIVTTGPNIAVASTELIHGFTTPPPVGSPITSYFGSIDPTFNPDKFPAGGNGTIDDPTDSASPTIPWAWPKLIRVTLSLADPNDPSIERTFQFVFQVPDRDGV